MNKNEILEKSRKDNGTTDERFTLMQQRTTVVMVSAMMAMWLVLFLWNVVRGADTSEGGAIMLSGIAAMGFCQFYQLRTKTSLVFGVLAAFGALSFAAEHFLSTL